MDTWTRQMGFPVLELKRSGDGASYIVTQRRFLADKEAKDTTESPYGSVIAQELAQKLAQVDPRSPGISSGVQEQFCVSLDLIIRYTSLRYECSANTMTLLPSE